MENYTIVEKYQQGKDSTVAIRPYFNPDRENMGLETYGMSLHEGVWHQESLACLELNRIKRYVTGLNEFAPEIKKLSPGEREIKVKEIRKTVAQLEAELAANIIDPEDKDFWNKVTLLKPDNDAFWSRIELRCGNEPVFLDPTKDPYDLIKIHAINAGGFSMIAKSLKDAKKKANPTKFYLDQLEETVSTRTEYKKLKNKALAKLEDLYDKNKSKLMYVAKVVDSDSVQYTKSTSADIMYENMDAYISGDGTESNKKRAAESFIEASKNKKITINEITKNVTKVFHENCKSLNCLVPTKEPRATDHIQEMVEMTKSLIEKNFAYTVEGHVYFSVSSFKEYGKLSNKNLDELKAGSRIEISKLKKNPMDFVLWKPSLPDDPGWESPWGIGRPGWHLECSVMSEKYLGKNFDIHGGGLDLIFPHHENEIAQSCCNNSTEKWISK